MSNYITDTFSRMDLQRLREFMVYGTSGSALEAEAYQAYDKRLKESSDPIYNRLRSIYPNESDMNEAATDLSEALSVRDEVYMEIGMKAGARLIYQLLLTDNPTPPIQEKGDQHEPK